MQRFHPLSFVLGIVSGLVILVLVAGTMRMFTPASSATARSGGFGNGGTQNLSRLSQRLGISESDLQKELASGKTLQEIAQEHGVQLGNGRGFNRSSVSGSGAVDVRTGTGSSSPVLSSSSAQSSLGGK
jgi:hypothetical protein